VDYKITAVRYPDPSHNRPK